MGVSGKSPKTFRSTRKTCKYIHVRKKLNHLSLQLTLQGLLKVRLITFHAVSICLTTSKEYPPLQCSHPAADAAIDDRDYTFRFDVPEPLPPVRTIFDAAEKHAFWQPVLLLVSYLNLRHHASHRACNLVLSAFRLLLGKLGHFTDTDKLTRTLRTAFSSIGLKDPFVILPMCTNCRRVFPADSPIGLRCYNCVIPLFKTRATLEYNFDGSDRKSEELVSVARLKCPFYSLSSQLPAFVCRFEQELEESLRVDPQSAYLRDIRDGRVWKEARAEDGSSFFAPDRPDVLRIGVILHFDG